MEVPRRILKNAYLLLRRKLFALNFHNFKTDKYTVVVNNPRLPNEINMMYSIQLDIGTVLPNTKHTIYGVSKSWSIYVEVRAAEVVIIAV